MQRKVWRQRRRPGEGRRGPQRVKDKCDGVAGVSLDLLHGGKRGFRGSQVWVASGRQKNDEGRAALGTIVRGNLAFMLLNNAVARAEAQASSLPDGFGGVERLENMFRFLDTAAGIGELDADPGAGGRDGDVESASAHLFQRINGVGDDLQEDMEKLAGIAANQRRRPKLVQINANIRELGNTAEMQGAFDQGFNLERDDLQRCFLG